MMTINNVSMNNTNLNVTSSTSVTSSSEAKALQSQLAGKQQNLNRLSSDSEMTAADKEKERRKIQREIAELNRKLQQERMEEKEKAKEAAKEQSKKKVIREELLEQENSVEHKEAQTNKGDLPSDKEEEKTVNPGLPVVTIKNVLAAATDINLETVQENIAQQAENRQNILATEIRSDELYGTDTTSKKEELSDMRKQQPFQIQSIGQQPEQVTPSLDFGSKIIIRE